MVERRMPSPLSAGGVLQARIPLAAKRVIKKKGIESRNWFMRVLDLQPPAFDRCQMTGLRPPAITLVPNPLIMPGIDPPGKRFYIAVNPNERTLTSPCVRN